MVEPSNLVVLLPLQDATAEGIAGDQQALKDRFDIICQPFGLGQQQVYLVYPDCSIPRGQKLYHLSLCLNRLEYKYCV